MAYHKCHTFCEVHPLYVCVIVDERLWVNMSNTRQSLKYLIQADVNT